MNYVTEVAKKLLEIKAIKLSPQTPFTWASGMLSPIYCDNRVSLSYVETRDLIKEGLAQLTSNFGEFDIIAGVATAGIAHGALLADYMHKPFAYVRAQAKGHGRQNQIEGEIKTGQRVLVIEDLISTGGSSIAAINVLKEAGFEVVGALAIFTYGFDIARENFANAEIKLETLTNYNSLLEIAQQEDYISKAEMGVLTEWNTDPKKWSDDRK